MDRPCRAARTRSSSMTRSSRFLMLIAATFTTALVASNDSKEWSALVGPGALGVPAVPVHDVLDRTAFRLGPPALRGISHGDQGHGERVGRETEQFAQFLLVAAVQRGQGGADAVGAGGEAEL